jgi:putative heme iron utilization protein
MTDAEIARDLAARVKHATLATLMVRGLRPPTPPRDSSGRSALRAPLPSGLRPPGHPFASLVAVAADESGRPLLLLSKLAEHTKNLDACDKASILYAEPDLAAARVTLLGTCTRVDDAAVRARYLAIHPDAEQWASFADFSFFRLEPMELRVVVGFGRMSWVSAEDYVRARSSS